MSLAPPSRRRGRPMGGGGGGRERILAAAEHEFGAHGYDGATIRSIALRAQVDTALVHHYFGKKSDLFAAVVDIPVNPAQLLAAAFDGELEDAGRGSWGMWWRCGILRDFAGEGSLWREPPSGTGGRPRCSSGSYLGRSSLVSPSDSDPMKGRRGAHPWWPPRSLA